MSDDMRPERVSLETMPELVLVSGMSGAGRTEAMHVFEDMGYFCVDNLPPNLIGNLLDLHDFTREAAEPARIAVVCDARTRGFFAALTQTLADLDKRDIDCSILFLDAEDEKLIARYKSSRRRHPLCVDGATISTGIARERSLLQELRDRADLVVDTTNLLPADLRVKLMQYYTGSEQRHVLAVSVYSFGFKHGNPADADLVIDVRFLPNPFYDPRMRTLTGLDEPVRNYVLRNGDTERFVKAWKGLLDCVMPGYVAEGKQQLAIAVGCTGGQHRSVVLAEVTGDYLRSCGYRVSVAHRDLSLAERDDGKLVHEYDFEEAAAELGTEEQA